MTHTVRLVVMPEGVDVESGRLWATGPLGVEERPTPDGRVALLATFAESASAIAALDSIAGLETVIPEAGRHGSERPYAPVSRVGPFVIAPPWESPDLAAARYHLIIDPGEAFGHGAHPTTRLLLAAMVNLDLEGLRVADIGCDTGVLAIAAARLGAASVVAVDNDQAAVAVSRSNVEANRCDAIVNVALVDATSPIDAVDVAFVNVTIDVHEHIAASIDSSATTVVAGGVLHGQIDRLKSAYPGHVAASMTADGEWRAVVFEPRRSTS